MKFTITVDRDAVAAKIKELKKNTGLTWPLFAEQAGVEFCTVKRAAGQERGRTVRPKTIRKICDAFGVDYGEFIKNCIRNTPSKRQEPYVKESLRCLDR